uniref:Uncharacterized protein n=1 Tax=Nelumbo nucifera TaxID=4432 RepID=A0A822XEX7_NELNU|nr:TPA_asm: hypothetical protein HUJ06_019656 [Nelumbo nucifera]
MDLLLHLWNSRKWLFGKPLKFSGMHVLFCLLFLFKPFYLYNRAGA